MSVKSKPSTKRQRCGSKTSETFLGNTELFRLLTLCMLVGFVPNSKKAGVDFSRLKTQLGVIFPPPCFSPPYGSRDSFHDFCTGSAFWTGESGVHLCHLECITGKMQKSAQRVIRNP